MVEITINSLKVNVEEDLTVMQACEELGIEIPHFCFHERLNISGNCRMCLVESNNSQKLIASCATKVQKDLVIKTNTPKVTLARESVLEFLLINHPLDCPICDQGGECDLQDQAFKYGKRFSRFKEPKRSVTNKYFGPLISTNMTRCIHCTRCVRFMDEIAGVSELGTLYRGENTEIDKYLEGIFTSELSGNIIDLCPVGALTSKPYQFTSRIWELEKTESIDVLDAMGSNIRIDSKGVNVMRILPKINDDINEEWISDKSRFSYDGLRYQRLSIPLIRKEKKLVKISWQRAISEIVDKVRSTTEENQIAALAGFFSSLESMFLMKILLNKCNSTLHDANQLGYRLDTENRGNYLFNTEFKNIEQADLCLLIGANPRQVAPVLNARIGRAVRTLGLNVFRIGVEDNQTYKINELGNKTTIFKEILNGTHKICKELSSDKKVMFIVGDGILLRSDSLSILSLIHKIIEKYKLNTDSWNGFNILHNHASAVGALDIGFHYGLDGSRKILTQANAGKIKVLYLLGADDFDISSFNKEKVFVIYQGSHWDKGAEIADLILPASSYTEEDAIHVNMEGRPQYARKAVSPHREIMQNWQIINSIISEIDLSYKNLDLKEIRKKMSQEYPFLNNMDKVINAKMTPLKSGEELSSSNITKITNNYYITDHITRASTNMARCLKYRQSLNN